MKPFYKNNGVRLFNGDAIQVLSALNTCPSDIAGQIETAKLARHKELEKNIYYRDYNY